MLRYISSVMYQKRSLRVSVFQYQTLFTLLTLLIRPRRAYHKLALPTAILNFEKMQQSPNYLMATAHHSK